MAQITWRNVQGPNMGPAVQMTKTGLNQINNALGGFTEIIDAQTAVNNANWDNQKKRNTDDIQNRIMGATTMNQLAALTPALTPEKLRAEFGGQYDQGAVNKMLADRPKQLMSDMMTSMQVKDMQRAELSKPYEDQFYALLSSSPQAASEFLQKNIANIYDAAPLTRDLQNIVMRDENTQMRKYVADVNAETRRQATQMREQSLQTFREAQQGMAREKAKQEQYNKLLPQVLEQAKGLAGATGAGLAGQLSKSAPGELAILNNYMSLYKDKTMVDVLNDLVKSASGGDTKEIVTDFNALIADNPNMTPAMAAFASRSAVTDPYFGDFGFDQSAAQEQADLLNTPQGKAYSAALKKLDGFNASYAGALPTIAAEKASDGVSPTEERLLKKANELSSEFAKFAPQ